MKTDIIICHLKGRNSESHPISRGELGSEVARLATEINITLTKKEIAKIMNLFILEDGQKPHELHKDKQVPNKIDLNQI
ncbi:MAG: hypothetical protein RR277_00405 [Rikenellaceae bacterium]